MNRSAIRPFALATPLVLLLAVTATSQAPPPASPEAREKMQALAGMVGEWQGEAWSELRPGMRETAVQHELVEWAAGEEALLVRGTGTVDGRTVHQAIALIYWDARQQRYAMTAYRAGSGPSTQEVRLEGGALVWGFSAPGGEIRFTQRFDEAGRWTEIGERSSDRGATWHPFLGMTLTRK